MLILSLFPGLGLLDRAFEEVMPESCIVRGPDALWGGNIKTFHPPSGKFDGIIGGPPCQAFSQLVHMVRHTFGEDKVAENLIPEFERCIREAQPTWFLMENVEKAPDPVVQGYHITTIILNNRWIGEVQNRVRKFAFGHREREINLVKYIDFVVFESADYHTAVLASGTRHAQIRLNAGGIPKKRLALQGASRRDIAESLRLQGLPEDFFNKKSPFTVKGQQMMIGNGVPLPMGKALAQAIKESLS